MLFVYGCEKAEYALYLKVSCTVGSRFLQLKTSSLVAQFHLFLLLVQLQKAILRVNPLCCFQNLVMRQRESK